MSTSVWSNGRANPSLVCPEKSSSANRCESGPGNCEPALHAGGQVAGNRCIWATGCAEALVGFGKVNDPFGHRWMVITSIDPRKVAAMQPAKWYLLLIRQWVPKYS